MHDLRLSQAAHNLHSRRESVAQPAIVLIWELCRNCVPAALPVGPSMIALSRSHGHLMHGLRLSQAAQHLYARQISHALPQLIRHAQMIFIGQLSNDFRAMVASCVISYCHKPPTACIQSGHVTSVSLAGGSLFFLLSQPMLCTLT